MFVDRENLKDGGTSKSTIDDNDRKNWKLDVNLWNIQDPKSDTDVYVVPDLNSVPKFDTGVHVVSDLKSVRFLYLGKEIFYAYFLV